MNIFQDLIQKVLVVITSLVVGVTGVFTGQKPLPTPTPSPIVEQHPSPSPTPSITPSLKPILRTTPKSSGTPKVELTPLSQTKWTFTKDQYEIKVATVNYGTNNNYSENTNGRYFMKGEFIIKNISIQPFIISYSTSGCEIVKDDQKVNFKLGTLGSLQDILRKGLLPGESITIPIDTWFVSGGDYDSSGNLIYPPAGLKIKSCEMTVKTKDSTNIEPNIVNFPTL